jgi:Ferredoxin-dependent bilin reductase
MSIVWEKIEALAKHFEQEFNRTGTPIEGSLGEEYEWHNQLWTSDRYRRAHLEVVDHRESHKLFIVHCTVFPHFNDPSPIWGFDAVCGKNKITGAFHDYSISGDPNSFMYLWFKAQVNGLEWNKPRELPEWARQIFSPAMVAAGNLQEITEIDQLCDTAKNTLDFYLKNVGFDQQSLADYHMAQNKYCHWQKQNPHVIRSMVSMGIDETKMKRFVNEVLFPEIH